MFVASITQSDKVLIIGMEIALQSSYEKSTHMIGMEKVLRDEEARLQNLHTYRVLYTQSEPIFDQLAALTVTMLNTPVAMINFIDRDKVWTKANQNGEAGFETERRASLCSLTVLSAEVVVFEDITKELIAGEMQVLADGFEIKFYAAAPIITKEGFNIGSICIMDKIARTFSKSERNKLTWIASMISNEICKRIGQMPELV